MALDLCIGDGDIPVMVTRWQFITMEGWKQNKESRFDSTYDHKDETGEPIPFIFILGSGKFFDRQRLLTTIFNPMGLANGEGSTLGTLIFDSELVSLRHH